MRTQPGKSERTAGGRRVDSWRSELPSLAAVMCLAIAGSAGLAQGLDFGSRDARSSPASLAKASIYEIWLDAFSEQGNLRGAIPRLNEVAQLGATIVYLGPIAKRSAEPHASPYSIADYDAVDPEAGSEQDLRDFVAAAHALHLQVMLDVVFYHTAPGHVWRKTHPEFFRKAEDGALVRGFWPQPLPDFTNPAVRQALTESLVHWVRDFGVDGVRCDVGGGVPVTFWEGARQALDAVRPGVLLLSESDRPDDQLRAFDLNYNFQWYLTLRSVLRDGAPASALRANWEQMHRTMPHGARLLHFSDNHDWPRAVLQFGERGAMAASLLDFTLDGVPFLYNGQEIDDPLPTSWRRVVPIHWPPSDRAEAGTAGETRDRYTRLFHLRATEPALSAGEVVWVNNSAPESVVSFLRRKGSTEVLVMVNLSNRRTPVTVDLPVMEYSSVDNLLEPGATYFSLYSGRVSAELPAFGFVVGRKIPLAKLQQ